MVRMTEEKEPQSDAVNRRLGEHLRRLRKQQGLSLLDVQAMSDGEFKASVMGAYERGERAVSAVRLSRLASLYRLPLQAMLPSADSGETTTGVVAIDTTRLDAAKSPEANALARFVRRMQALRQDWTQPIVRIRSEDLVALASAVDKSPAELVQIIDDEGLRAY
jgi:transcriptional regulator with XRE-family HTH domain